MEPPDHNLNTTERIVYGTIFLGAVLLAIVLIGIALLWTSTLVARRKQLKLGFVARIAGGVFGGVLAAAFGAAAMLPAAHQPVDTTTPSGAAAFLGVVFGVLVACQAITALLLVLLLPKARRLSGDRRVHVSYQLLWRLGVVGSLLLPAVLLLAGLSAAVAGRVFVFGALVVGGLGYLSRRARIPSLDEEIDRDPRPPVLYVRPFEQDAELFAELPRRRRDVLSDYVRATNREPSRHLQTFEEYFSEAVSAELGPLVALGDPTDRLPPLGAARGYRSDDTWRDDSATLPSGLVA